MAHELLAEPFRPLPVPRSPLIGRAEALATARSRLLDAAVPLLTLTGAGGAGKTRLALAIATEVAAAYDGLLFVDLARVTDPSLVRDTVADAVGVSASRNRPWPELLAAALRSRRVLMLIDNCEHLAPAVADAVAEVLEAWPGLQVLATSRAPLRLRDEHELPVPPLALPVALPVALPASAPVTPEGLIEGEACQLFVQRARAVDPEFALTPDTVAAVADICRRLDGLPLAIELAAARVKVLSPVALLNRLDRRLPELTTRWRDVPERQRTMRDAIAWSYDLLTHPEQDLFRRLAVFVGGFDVAGASAMVESYGESGHELFERIASLIDQSLLYHVGDVSGEPRYAMLETVREYALEQLAASGEALTARAAHAAYFGDLVERLVPEVPGQSLDPWAGIIDADYPNVRAALEWFADAGEPTAFLQMASRLWLYWDYRGHLNEARHWMGYAASWLDGAPPDLYTRFLHHQGQLAHLLGDDERAVPLLQEALVRSRAHDQWWLTPYSLLWLGIVEEDRGAFEAGSRWFREALDLYEQWGDQNMAALTVCHLGISAYGGGDHEGASETLSQALAKGRAAGDPVTIAESLWLLALIACDVNDLTEASRNLGEALDLVVSESDRVGIAYCLACFGVLGTRSQQPAAGTRLLSAAATLRGTIGEMVGLPEREVFARAANDAREALGETAFAAAWLAGGELPHDQAISAARAIGEHAAAATGVRVPADSHGLTMRETDVLRLLVQGYSDKEIGTSLFLSHRTVMRHVTSILAKLGVENRTAATNYAIRHNLV